MALVICVAVSIISILFFTYKVFSTIRKTNWLTPYSNEDDEVLAKILKDKKVSIIIPAHNEDLYIGDCVRSLLNDLQLPQHQLEIIAVNDNSTDNTKKILEDLKKETTNSQLKVIDCKSKPSDEVWISKNWACFQGAQKATGDYMLFIDADIFLQPGALKSALLQMHRTKADLLSFYPRKILKCLTEWIVEPTLVICNLAWPRFVHVSDPKRAEVFTPGWFMFFKRSAYEAIGGHKSVANCVLEDIELGKRIKRKGFRIEFCLGPKLAGMRMYDSFSELWEGYTKNFYCGLNHKPTHAIGTAIVFVWTFAVPYLGIFYSLYKLAFSSFGLSTLLLLGLSSLAISLHVFLRYKIQKQLQISKAYWWAMGLGGILLAALMIHSMIKHKSGKGYTWKGLPLPQH